MGCGGRFGESPSEKGLEAEARFLLKELVKALCRSRATHPPRRPPQRTPGPRGWPARPPHVRAHTRASGCISTHHSSLPSLAWLCRPSGVGVCVCVDVRACMGVCACVGRVRL